METLHNRDIIVTGLQCWDIEIGSNCKNIAIEFAKTNRVLFVNPPIDRFTNLRGSYSIGTANYRAVKSQFLSNPRQVMPNLWVFTPERLIESISRLPNTFLFDLFNKHNNRVFAREIINAIECLQFSNYIHFCDSDMFRSFYLKDLLNPDLYIYYSRDNLLAVDYWKVQGNRIEPLHKSKADIVLCNSNYLQSESNQYNENSYFIGQGCDLDAFSPDHQYSVPSDIAKIAKPIIGYIGALSSLRLDIDLLYHIAHARPEWNLVLVGAEDDAFVHSKLHDLHNIKFLGAKKPEELPAYLKMFTIAINPQSINAVTIGNYPRKIDEYLAMGKPVVATKTETMQFFANHVSLATTPDQWVKLIDWELHNDSNEKYIQRRDFASQHTWQNNVEQIYKYINKHLQTKLEYQTVYRLSNKYRRYENSIFAV